MPESELEPRERTKRKTAELALQTQVAITSPPAARMTSPVIQADSSDARKTATGAISVTRPSRPSFALGAIPDKAERRLPRIEIQFCIPGLSSTIRKITHDLPRLSTGRKSRRWLLARRKEMAIQPGNRASRPTKTYCSRRELQRIEVPNKRGPREGNPHSLEVARSCGLTPQ